MKYGQFITVQTRWEDIVIVYCMEGNDNLSPNLMLGCVMKWHTNFSLSNQIPFPFLAKGKIGLDRKMAHLLH